MYYAIINKSQTRFALKLHEVDIVEQLVFRKIGRTAQYQMFPLDYLLPVRFYLDWIRFLKGCR